ncbi:MAG: serine hydrolase domain-containing protein [Gemmatimonadaceae bacterium]
MRITFVFACATWAATLVPPADAQTSSIAPLPAQLGFAPDRLARIDNFMRLAVDSNRIAGAVVLVMRDGQVAYERAFGWADKEAGRRMTTDAIFRIASQSKSITSAALLSLVEEGKLALNDPVGLYVPTLARARVASLTDTGTAIVPAKRAIRLADLLTHTAGISYGTDTLVASLYRAKGLGPAAGFGWYTADKDEPICETMERLGTLPFIAQPGEKFVYGYSTDILGCVAERASGMTLDDLIRTRILNPLGMADTYFFLPPGKRHRLVAVYASDSTNHVVRAAEGARGQGHYIDGPRRSYAGGAGLVSTARDYARFLEAMRNGGALGPVRVLAPHTVELMTTNQIGVIYSTNGLGHGFGFETVDRYGARGMSSVGTFGWGGAYGSTYFVDPRERLVAILMMNQIPNRTDVRAKFSTLVYQALVGPQR